MVYVGFTRDNDVLGGESRIEGGGSAFAHVSARVIGGGQSPAYVADQLNVSLSAVYETLSYYYAHIEEMRGLERENETAFERVRERPLKPREQI